MVIDHGVIPIIAARANSVGTILKQKQEPTSEEYTYQGNFIYSLVKYTILEPLLKERTQMK